jgi:hypothetical protein
MVIFTDKRFSMLSTRNIEWQLFTRCCVGYPRVRVCKHLSKDVLYEFLTKLMILLDLCEKPV